MTDDITIHEELQRPERERAAATVEWSLRGETIVMDPTGERHPAVRALAERPASLTGKVVALLDISKPRGDVFLDRLAERLGERGLEVRRYRKPTFTKPAPIDLRHEISVSCDVVIEALAD